MSVDTIEIETVQAGLIAEILTESEVLREQGEAQAIRLAIADELKATTLRANQQMTECATIALACKGRLHSIAKAKAELLRSTPEGRQIRSIQAEIAKTKWIDGVPQLGLLRHKRELAEARGEFENVQVLTSQLANLESKIGQKQAEIDRLWSGFGFDADSLPSV